jgi:ABC-type antimicrobial peptide transport system permease subunit
MLRPILGAIVGYIALFVFIFVTFSATYVAMGADRAFNPDSYQVSTAWIAVSSVLGLIGAVIGGYVASLVGKGMNAVKILAGIILLMGVLTIAMTAMTPAPTAPRTADVPNLEAMSKAQTPLWVAAINPLIGIAGALIGGRLRKDRSESA